MIKEKYNLNLLISTILLAIISVFSFTTEVSADNDLFYYEVNNNEVVITGIKNVTSKELVIPNEIDGYPVKEINKKSLKYIRKIETLIISEGIEVIGDDSISYMPDLKTVKLPSTIKKIGKKAFSNDSKLVSINLPDSLERLEPYTFAYDSSLVNINLPSKLKYLGEYTQDANSNWNVGVFYGCTSLKSITLPKGLLVIGDGAFSSSGIASIVIPNSVTTIGKYAFYNSKLTEITIPASVVNFSESIFENSSNLKSVVLNNNISRLYRTFYNCTSLESVKMNGTVYDINSAAFYNTPLLKSIDIPKTLRNIGVSAFYNSGVEKITLPYGIYSIPSGTFANSKIKNINIPSSVYSISNDAFDNTDVTMEVVENSYGEKYAIDHKFNYVSKLSFENVEIKNNFEIQLFTGKPIKPDLVLVDKGKTLVKGKDYTISYSDNINPGTGYITVKGIGKYGDYQTYHFEITKHINDGLYQVYNGRESIFKYYKNGKFDPTFTGVANRAEEYPYYDDPDERGSSGCSDVIGYYVKNGIVDFSHNDLIKYKGRWTPVVGGLLLSNVCTGRYSTGIYTNKNGSYLLVNGILSFDYNGYYFEESWEENGYIYKLTNSKVDQSFSGLKKIDKVWYYFVKGKSDLSYNGFASNNNGTYYIDNGRITFNHNELMKYKGKWTAVVNSKVQPTYTGLSTNNNGTYYLEKGVLSFKYNGTYKDNTGNIYVIKNSKVDTSFTGLKKVSSTWYYFKNGKTDLTYTGYASNNNGTFYVENGIITFKFNKLVKYNGKWAAIVASKVTPNYTGISTNNNGSYYLKNGEVQFGFSGTITWKGKTYTVVKGKVNM